MIQASTDAASEISELSSISVEIIDAKELAQRWRLPESWLRDRVRTRSDDPLPHVKVGRYVRFEWGNPEPIQWRARHRVFKQARNGGGY